MADPLFTLSGETETMLAKGGKAPRDAASTLLWAAFNLRAARIGRRIVSELAADSVGFARPTKVLHEEWDVLEIAAMSLAFEDTMSALDLCANVLFLASGGTPAVSGKFKDLGYWTSARIAAVPAASQTWITGLLASSEYAELKIARDALTHRFVSRHIRLGGGVGRALAEISTPTRNLGPIDVLIPRLVRFGEQAFETFCGALQTDFG